MRKILIEEMSPVCNIQAFVEEYDNCAYFYLWNFPGEKDSCIRSCWIRNYTKAPEKLDIETMKEGNAPMLPAKFCRHPEGSEKLKPENLSIVWFEEGDSAALLYENEILGVIPGWAGMNKDYPFLSYARDCIKESDLCLPLGDPDSNALFKRVKNSKMFWEKWENNLWPSVQQEFLEIIESRVGKIEKYYAIDGGKWPPKAMVKVVNNNITYIITIGTSILPQPKVEEYIEKPELLRRFELAFAIETKWLEKDESNILKYISAQTSLPWSNLTFLADGHTIPCKEMSKIKKKFEYVLLTKPNNAPLHNTIKVEGDVVNILWMVPITSKERKFAEKFGSDSLVAKKKDEFYWIFNGKTNFI